MNSVVVLEGIDGSGKETQTRKLLKRLRREGYDVSAMEYPTYEGAFYKPLGTFLEGKTKGLTQKQISVLFGVDRLGAKDELTSLLEKGDVICDRYVTANKLYQSVGVDDKDEFLDWLDQFEYDILGLPREEKTIFLDIPVDLALKNMAGKEKDVNESNVPFLRKVRESSHYVAERDDWVVIKCYEDGSMRSIESIHEDIYAEVCAVLD